MGQPFDDGGFADARRTDQHGIVLGASLQNLDGATDFVIATDNGIELSLLGAFSQVNRVLLQRLARFLGIGVVYLLSAPELVDGFFDGTAYGACLLQNLE